MRFKREQGIGEEEALAKAGTLVGAQTEFKQKTAEEKTAIRQRAAEEKAAARERAAGEKDATRELREQESLRQKMSRGTVTLGRGMLNGGSLTGGVASLAGAAAMGGPATLAVLAAGMAAEEATKDFMERQGIANRDRASRASDQRNLNISAGWRGTSSQVQSQQFGTEQEIFDREHQREEILRRNKRAPWNPLRVFGATTWEGERERDDNEKNIERLKKRHDAEEKLGHKKFTEEEGGLELDAVRQRSKRTMSGIRAAQVDDLARSGMGEYRRFKAMGATDDQAKEGAMLKTENDLRDRQIASASGLVDARSGAGDIAAAARWAQESMPGLNDLKNVLSQKLDQLHNTTKQGVDESALTPFGNQ